MMRTARVKPVAADAEGTYYHIVNRVAGSPGDLPFGEIEKERFVRLLHWLATLYTVEPLAWMVMGNHFHILLFAPAEAPSPEETTHRYAAFHGGARAPLDPDSPQCRTLAPRLRDISWFTRDLECRFTRWFNRHGGANRRGSLWQQRFKSVVIEGVGAVWQCLEYIEMNPIRAKLVADPADYRFGSWGAWCGSGEHPYAEKLLRHLRRNRGAHTAEWTLADFARELRKEFARVQAGEAGGSTAEIEQAVAAAAPEPPALTVITRRVRYWTDGLAIGSKRFLRETLGLFLPPERVQRHRLSPPTTLVAAGATHAPPLEIHAWRRPRLGLGC
jgi:hypothetical protein